MLPALAVAESLRKLGAEVTFASNADSRLVRDAGYELDVFGVERGSVCLGMKPSATFFHRRKS